MKIILKISLPLLFVVGVLTSCADINKKAEEKLNELN